MMPEREGNRMTSALDTRKARALGWEPSRRLEDYLEEFLSTQPRGAKLPSRVLVFSTTFVPTTGPAEDALVELMRQMPTVHFDVVTTCFTRGAKHTPPPAENIHIHRVGFGNRYDKYLLPVLGYRKARSLAREHRYLFAWAIFASYAALAAIALKRFTGLPLLITLANQDLSAVSPLRRIFLRFALTDADQVYGMEAKHERHAERLARKAVRQSMGEGDAFANQIRFAYAVALKKRMR